jgi:hypothetical protein
MSLLTALLAVGLTKPSSLPPTPKPSRKSGRGSNHAAGKRIQAPDGTVYRVGKGGAWIRESPRRCEARDYKDLHNHSVRRRVLGL